MKYLKRLKDLREDHDYKQESVANYLNITRQQYQLYESGKRKLPIDKLIEICELYNVSADYVLGLSKDPKPNWTVQNNIKSKNNVNISHVKNVKNININNK